MCNVLDKNWSMYLIREKQISRHADEHSRRFYMGVPPGELKYHSP